MYVVAQIADRAGCMPAFRLGVTPGVIPRTSPVVALVVVSAAHGALSDAGHLSMNIFAVGFAGEGFRP